MDLPNPPKFKNLIGPSFILLGLGLGSGEIILWPYLVSNWGLSIIWGAILGVTLQFFINMEIERYALIKGQSVFVGFSKFGKIFPLWFIFSTLAAWIWPGIIATSAKLLSSVFNITNSNLLGIILLIVIGLVLSLGPVLYKTVEKISLILIAIGLPAIFFLTIYIAKTSDYQELFKGLVGFVNGFPLGLPISSFLAAFAFSGAGGNLNLAQSFYIKEKGYGMGKYGGKITSLLVGKKEDIKLEGVDFKLNDDNTQKFFKWWKIINLEHFLVFWIGGVFSILLLSLLAYSTSFGLTTPIAGVSFMLFEAGEIAKNTLPFLGVFFLVITGLMLFNTQLTVFDATSRIMAENIIIFFKNKIAVSNLPKAYYLVLWTQIILGIFIFILGFGQPLYLVTISAVMNAFSMFLYIGLIYILNRKQLDKRFWPGAIRSLILFFAIIFFGYLSFRTISGR